MNERKRILINYRLEQAQQAIVDAKLLSEEGGSFRGIINRAYYGMFYSVLALLVEIGKGTSKHSGAIALFDAEFIKKETLPRELSRILHKAFDLRQVSDYRELTEVDVEDAKEVLEQAERFVEAVREYLATA